MKKAGHFLLLAVVAGCSQLLGEQGNGVRTTADYELEPYNEIAVSGAFSVKLVPGEGTTVSLETDENLVEFIEIFVENGKLVVHTDYRLVSDGGQQVRVPVSSQVERLYLAGANKVTTTDTLLLPALDITVAGVGKLDLLLNTEDLHLSLAGTASVILQGQAARLTANMSGAGKLDAGRLDATTARITLSGAGKAVVYATDTLESHVSGVGKVEYLGEPTVVLGDVSGIGKVKKKDE